MNGLVYFPMFPLFVGAQQYASTLICLGVRTSGCDDGFANICANTSKKAGKGTGSVNFTRMRFVIVSPHGKTRHFLYFRN